MGMYCCCGKKIKEKGEWECICDWEGWTSCCDYPEERKNKNIPISNPSKDGKYLTRCQSGSADRYEEERNFFEKPMNVNCGYTGQPFEVNWDGDKDEQPYAWKLLPEPPRDNELT